MRSSDGIAFIGMGSNLGDRRDYLLRAVEELHRQPDVAVLRCSSIYETAPVGLTEQPDYLNMVIAVRADLPAVELLQLLLKIERSMGRVRDVRWGPRTIDLDLLLFGRTALQTEELELPHPRIGERAFVLIPLLEIMQEDESIVPTASDWHHALEAVEGKEDVRLWLRTSWRSEFGRFEN